MPFLLLHVIPSNRTNARFRCEYFLPSHATWISLRCTFTVTFTFSPCFRLLAFRLLPFLFLTSPPPPSLSLHFYGAAEGNKSLIIGTSNSSFIFWKTKIINPTQRRHGCHESFRRLTSPLWHSPSCATPQVQQFGSQRFVR